MANHQCIPLGFLCAFFRALTRRAAIKATLLPLGSVAANSTITCLIKGTHGNSIFRSTIESYRTLPLFSSLGSHVRLVLHSRSYKRLRMDVRRNKLPNPGGGTRCDAHGQRYQCTRPLITVAN